MTHHHHQQKQKQQGVTIQACANFACIGSSIFSLVDLHFFCLLENTHTLLLNPLTPNDPYSGRTAPLTTKRCILYIYSTNIGTEYFKHGIYSPYFSLQNAVCFIILTYLVPVLFTFYIQCVLKFKKNNSGAIRLNAYIVHFSEILCPLAYIIDIPCIIHFHCYTVHVVELPNYYTNPCTYIKFYILKH